jgi:hypothetical protein
LSLVDELRKHAHYTQTLRRHAMIKEALLGAAVKGVAKLGLKGVGSVGKFAIKNPGKAAVGGLGVMGAVGKSKSTMPGFNPDIHRLQLGMTQ